MTIGKIYNNIMSNLQDMGNTIGNLTGSAIDIPTRPHSWQHYQNQPSRRLSSSQTTTTSFPSWTTAQTVYAATPAYEELLKIPLDRFYLILETGAAYLPPLLRDATYHKPHIVRIYRNEKFPSHDRNNVSREAFDAAYAILTSHPELPVEEAIRWAAKRDEVWDKFQKYGEYSSQEPVKHFSQNEDLNQRYQELLKKMDDINKPIGTSNAWTTVAGTSNPLTLMYKDVI